MTNHRSAENPPDGTIGFGYFEKFGRVATDREYGGLGLGLWISWEIVTAMDGRTDVASSPGAGATFTVTLPFH